MPSLIADFGRKLSLISSHEQKFSSSSSSHAPLLALAGSKKSLANEFKRSKGKRSMMRKLALVAERQHEEERLCVAAPEAESLLARLGQIYDCLRELEKTSAVLEKLRGVYAGAAHVPASLPANVLIAPFVPMQYPPAIIDILFLYCVLIRIALCHAMYCTVL